MTEHQLRASVETCHWGLFDAALPPVLHVESGDRLTADEFRRRFERMPRLRKAELVKGVVEFTGGCIAVLTSTIGLVGKAAVDASDHRAAVVERNRPIILRSDRKRRARDSRTERVGDQGR